MKKIYKGWELCPRITRTCQTHTGVVKRDRTVKSFEGLQETGDMIVPHHPQGVTLCIPGKRRAGGVLHEAVNSAGGRRFIEVASPAHPSHYSSSNPAFDFISILVQSYHRNSKGPGDH